MEDVNEIRAYFEYVAFNRGIGTSYLIVVVTVCYLPAERFGIRIHEILISPKMAPTNCQ
jgi:hypothetical protein